MLRKIKIVLLGHRGSFKVLFGVIEDERFENSLEYQELISHQQNIELVLLFASATQMLHCLKSVTNYRQSIE